MRRGPGLTQRRNDAMIMKGPDALGGLGVLRRYVLQFF